MCLRRVGCQEGIEEHTGHSAAAEQLVSLESKMGSMLEAAATYQEGLRLAREKFVQIGILDKVSSCAVEFNFEYAAL